MRGSPGQGGGAPPAQPPRHMPRVPMPCQVNAPANSIMWQPLQPALVPVTQAPPRLPWVPCRFVKYLSNLALLLEAQGDMAAQLSFEWSSPTSGRGFKYFQIRGLKQEQAMVGRGGALGSAGEGGQQDGGGTAAATAPRCCSVHSHPTPPLPHTSPRAAPQATFLYASLERQLGHQRVDDAMGLSAGSTAAMQGDQRAGTHRCCLAGGRARMAAVALTASPASCARQCPPPASAPSPPRPPQLSWRRRCAA